MKKRAVSVAEGGITLNAMKQTNQTSSSPMLFAGIDYHKRYSVVHVLDADGNTVAKGRIEPNSFEAFFAFFSRFEGQVKCVFECSMNWGYLYDLLHDLPNVVEVQLAHPFRTRIIAEAQIKTDKIDSRWLAELLRVGLIAQSHASSKEARRRKELLRQRCFFVRQRTAIRNRVHVLLGSQRDLVMPQVSDIFGVKGMSALKKLRLAEPHERLLLDQDLAMLAAIKDQVKSAEKAIAGELKEDPTFQLLTSVPGLGPILAAVIASEIDGIERFRSSKKLLGCARLGWDWGQP